MRELTKEDLKYLLAPVDRFRGEDYFSRGRVITYRETASEESIDLFCVVRGTQPYKVEITLYAFDDEFEIESQCTCPRHTAAMSCKHVAAALYAMVDMHRHPERHRNWQFARLMRTSKAGSQLLNAMRGKDAPPPVGDDVRVVPVLHTEDVGSDLLMTLKIGSSRLYMVRDIDDFVYHVERGENHSYGKQLEFVHDPAAFDSQSRPLLDFVCRTVRGIRRLSHRAGILPRLRDGIYLSGEELAEQFDFLKSFSPLNADSRPLQMFDEDPVVKLQVVERNGVIVMAISIDPYLSRILNGGGRLFLCFPDRIVRTSESFAEAVGPLLASGEEPLTFAKEDMPAFCSLVLTKIRDHVHIEDNEGILSRYAPEECTPRFYFDMDLALYCRLVFHYDSGDIPFQTEAENVRRDVRVEAAAQRLLERDFNWNPRSEFFIQPDTNKALALLTGGMEPYRALGEVYISDRLRAKELKKPKAVLGVSLSGGCLLLEADLGDFPPEELEDLYQSMLVRRKYHLLKDGRFMVISGDGSGIEAVAEAAHMIQLPGEALKNGQATLPAFRAPYLEGLLEGKEGLRVHRDERFRDMARRFKTVEDSDYPLPGGIHAELRPYQETGFRWMKTLEHCGFGGILADEMGLGKTLQTIVYFSSLPRSETGLAHLVVSPASLVLNWADELARFAPDLRVRLISGSQKERVALIEGANDADVWVTSYDLLKRDIEHYKSHVFHTCVLDEGQFVKNQTTKASQAVKKVNCRQRFVLTGTPIENRLSELWNLFDFLMPGYLFSHQRFVERLERPIAQRGDAEAQTQLHKLVRPFLLRRLKKDVLKELPDKLEYVRRIAPGEDERKIYAAQAAQALEKLSGNSGKLAILAALTRLRQICCDPALCFENYVGGSSKLEACLELVQSMTENGHQILLFSQFTSMLDRIRDRLNQMRVSSFTLQGSTPKEERARLVREFNRGGAQVFLISLKAGGTGLNLTSADVVIHYDPWWNLAAQNQATDRAHRIGQRNCVQVYKLIVEGTIEESIQELQRRKASLLDAVAGESGEGILELSPEELLELIKPE